MKVNNNLVPRAFCHFLIWRQRDENLFVWPSTKIVKIQNALGTSLLLTFISYKLIERNAVNLELYFLFLIDKLFHILFLIERNAVNVFLIPYR